MIRISTKYLLMERKFVSKSEQMESPVECEDLLDEGHRCGACHKASDAKVRIMKAPYEIKNKIKNQSALSKCQCISYLLLTM